MRLLSHARPGLRIVASLFALAVLLGTAGRADAAFPTIPVWAYPGAYQGAGPDSILERERTVTVRWLRDPVAEARPDFGGYRIYRVVGCRRDSTELLGRCAPDTGQMSLVRRFSKQPGDSVISWHFANITPSTPEIDRVATFIDPDSNGAFFKVCRRVDRFGRCLSIGDSVLKLVPPPGPHDGFRVWYSITYEKKNTSSNDYEDLLVSGTCPGDPDPCNLNNKRNSLIASPVEPTAGPYANLETVAVVPNPFREGEAWDAAPNHELHFVHLPTPSRIRIYTVAGDMVAELQHGDSVRDFERWDLKNGRGQDVSSGIYLYRIESGSFSFQGRFVVIR